MVTNCDVISEIDYGEAIDYHKNNADATMIVNRHEIQNPFGVVETKENKFLSYTEKPIKYENISQGFTYLKLKTLNTSNMKPMKICHIFYKFSKKKQKSIVYPIFEKWNDLGHKKDLLNVE